MKRYRQQRCRLITYSWPICHFLLLSLLSRVTTGEKEKSEKPANPIEKIYTEHLGEGLAVITVDTYSVLDLMIK
ncbi:hypothetical protein CEXT_246771 [Caerostris extrusa]|uniref:Uncharacterized protein n=1 Tax=Caerostris extrusa TaxID=172846 RepID=A0AAV4YAM8_CAEEX|nr:hypothetical protein CEXT_246771 [Caerostris extrusa]